MSAKSLTCVFAIGLAILGYHAAIVSACRCVPPINAYCYTGFLSIVKINGVVVDQSAMKQRYYFDLVADLKFGDPHKRNLTGFHVIEDSTSDCGFFLRPHHTYLIGAFINPKTNKPELQACSSYVEQWDLTGEKSTAKLAEYARNCGH